MTEPAAPIPGTVQLPGIDWMLIHGQPGGVGTLRVDRSTAGDAVVDDEGRWTTTVVSYPVRGYLSLIGEKEVAWAASLAVKVDAVVAFSRATEVDETDAVTAAGIDRFLDGTYRITAVRATPVHIRCLLERMAGDPIQPAVPVVT